MCTGAQPRPRALRRSAAPPARTTTAPPTATAAPRRGRSHRLTAQVGPRGSGGGTALAGGLSLQGSGTSARRAGGAWRLPLGRHRAEAARRVATRLFRTRRRVQEAGARPATASTKVLVVGRKMRRLFRRRSGAAARTGTTREPLPPECGCGVGRGDAVRCGRWLPFRNVGGDAVRRIAQGGAHGEGSAASSASCSAPRRRRVAR